MLCPQKQKIRLLLNEQDAVGNTPLHYASVEGQPSVIRSLLSLGARLNVKNNSRQSPLHLAAKYVVVVATTDADVPYLHSR